MVAFIVLVVLYQVSNTIVFLTYEIKETYERMLKREFLYHKIGILDIVKYISAPIVLIFTTVITFGITYYYMKKLHDFEFKKYNSSMLKYFIIVLIGLTCWVFTILN